MKTTDRIDTNLPEVVLCLLVVFGLTLGSALSATSFTVTSTADSRAGSLRQGILDANANPGRDEIRFNIPAAGVQTINPLTPPPIITDTVHIIATDLLTGDTSEFSQWQDVNEKGSPTAYEHAASAAGGDGHYGNPNPDGDNGDLNQPAEASAEE